MYALPEDSDQADNVSVHQSVGHLQPEEEYQEDFESPEKHTEVKKPLVERTPEQRQSSKQQQLSSQVPQPPPSQVPQHSQPPPTQLPQHSQPTPSQVPPQIQQPSKAPQQAQQAPQQAQEHQQLSFRVVHCTSQDNNYLAQDLQSSSTSGWLSQRFCVYPQVISLQFPQAVKISKIQFLMHESLIPQTIHLHSSMPQTPLQPLGFFHLDDNKQSQYQSRELKTVYLDVVSQQFQVSFGKNYDNQLNKFNQVGVLRMQFFGQYLGSYEINSIYQSQHQSIDQTVPRPDLNKFQQQNDLKPRNLKISTVIESEFDQDLLLKLKLIESYKQQAVSDEDYDLAMQFKQICDQFKIMGTKLIALEKSKTEAVSGEDFQMAKQIKQEIDQIKSQIQSFNANDPFNQQQQQQQQQQQHSETPQKLMIVQQAIMETQIEQQQQEDYPEQEYEEVQPFFRPKNYDDQAVPALALKAPIDYNQVTDDVGGGIGGSIAPDESESLEYRDIPPTMKMFADALLPFYGELVCVKVFHRRWQFREQGVAQFIQDMPRVFRDCPQDQLTVLNSAVLTVLVEILKDKVQQIITKSVEAVESYISQLCLYPQLTVKSDQQGFEKLLIYILDRQTDKVLFPKTSKLYLGLYSVSQIDQQYLTQFLFKQSSYINKNFNNLTMHQALRLKITNDIINAGKAVEGFPADSVFPAIKACINASVAEQRKVALQLTVALYKALGWKKVEQMVHSSFPQKIMMQLKTDIPEVAAFIK